jgi:hypothetical protein
MSRLISQVELAALAHVSRPAISKACKGKFAPAMVGGRVDRDHPVVTAWLEGKGVKTEQPAAAHDAAPTKPAKTAKRKPPAPTAPAATPPAATAPAADDPTALRAPEGTTPEELAEVVESDVRGISSEEIGKLLRVLRPIVNRHGTRRGFKDWLGALKDLEDIRKKRLDNEETEGRLISRELVKTHVFGAIEGANRRLLGDFPKTITRLLYASANAKESIEVAEEKVRSAVTQILKPVKATATRVVEDA